jgi:hypothetical protein
MTCALPAAFDQPSRRYDAASSSLGGVAPRPDHTVSMPRRQPRKPSWPLASLIFPKQGTPYRRVEPLSDNQDDIELVIANKFVTTLNRRGCALELPQHPPKHDLWPDIQSRERGRTVGIEMVEVIHRGHAQKRALQNKYAVRVADHLRDVFPRLVGVRIQLDDGYQDPPYPPPDSPAGRRLAAEIADSIRQVVPELETLRVGSMRWYRWRDDPGEPQSGAVCIRLTQAEVGDQPLISYLGSFPESTEYLNGLLTVAIQNKVRKRYGLYYGSLWLLAYESSFPSGLDVSEAVQEARRWLAEAHGHPFDEVWYAFPFPGRDHAHIDRLLP